MITRGTTPYHSFILPLKKEEISEIWVTYLQNGEVVLNKTKKDLTIVNIEDLLENTLTEELTEEELNSSQVTLHLSQEDTLKFKFWPAAEKNIIAIQIRLLTTNQEAYASDPVRERLMGVLQDGIIEEEENSDETEDITD